MVILIKGKNQKLPFEPHAGIKFAHVLGSLYGRNLYFTSNLHTSTIICSLKPISLPESGLMYEAVLYASIDVDGRKVGVDIEKQN